MNLYQLRTEYQELLPHLYDAETGEIDETIKAEIDKLETSIEKKCEAVVCYVKDLELEKKKLETFEQELKLRKQAYESKIEKMQNYLISNMQMAQIEKIQCPLFTIKLKMNPYSTDIINENAIPEKFMNEREVIKVERKPDKNAIKEEFLSSGKQVPGTFVHRKTKLEIQIDKI